MNSEHSNSNPIPDKAKSILSGKNITIGYKKGKNVLKTVHENLDFDLYTGQVTCLLGPNGAGKSTLLRTLGATQHTIEGEIMLDGKPVSSLSPREISRYISVVLTDKGPVGGLRVEELIALGRHPHTGFFGRLNDEDKMIIEESMESVGLSDKKERYVAELSDGERQKVMIAKALAQQSPIILLDEPTSFLDIVSRIEVMNLLRKLAHRFRKAILLSTHDLEQAIISSDNLWLLFKEEGLVSGAPEDLILNNKLNSLFRHQDIVFDINSGIFRLDSRGMKKVYVKADSVNYFWSGNLLKRHGLEITDQMSESCTIRLEIHDSRRMLLHTPYKSVTLTSYKELAEYITLYQATCESED